MERSMAINSEDSPYIHVAILATGCVCEDCVKKDSPCNPSTLKDQHGRRVPARAERLTGIVGFTMPTIAEHSGCQLGTKWKRMREHPNPEYRRTYIHAVKHMSAPKGQPLSLYERLLRVAITV